MDRSHGRKGKILDNWNEFDDSTVFDPELLKKLNCDSKARLQKRCGSGQFPAALARYVAQGHFEIKGKMDESVPAWEIAGTDCAKRLELIRKAVKEGQWLRLELIYGYFCIFGYENEAYGLQVRKLERLLMAELKQSLLKG